jgi:uncharacterized protein (DUF983 family)
LSQLPDQPPSVWAAALKCRCPRCGRGPLFEGLLAVRPKCPACGLDLSGSDPGDGAVFAVLFVLTPVVVLLAIWLEIAVAPPLWVHAVIWPIFTLPAAVLLMRPSKAALIALQYRNRRSEMGL